MEHLMKYIKNGVSPYHTAALAEEELQAAGYEELELTGSWQLQRGRGYYVRSHGSTLFAFRVNPGFARSQSFRIAAAHTDWPCMRIKPQPELVSGVMEEQCADELRTFFRELREKRKLIRKAQKSEKAAAESGESQQDAFCEREK